MNSKDKETENGTEDQQELWKKLEGVRMAMLTTVEEDGTLRSRPMATQEVKGDGNLWFFTYDDSAKVQEIAKDQRVNLSYAATDKDLYVSVSGTARLVHDKAKAEELWNPFLKAWFPDGLEDPKLALLCVKVEQAEYWDSPSGKMVALFGLAKALITGKSMADTAGEDTKVTF